jgi:hypothetical protein
LILIEAFMEQMARPQPSALQSVLQSQAVSVPEPIAVGVSAAILAVHGNEPVVAVLPARREDAGASGTLPCGFYAPRQHRNLEAALRASVLHHTRIELGSVRQIGVHCDSEHDDVAGIAQASRLPIVAVSYLALVEPSHSGDAGGTTWRSWYAYFPWEDWRRGKPSCLTDDIEPRLKAWARLTPAHCEASAPPDQSDRGRRVCIAFGCDGVAWDEEKALERYDLLCQAGLLGETAAGLGHGTALGSLSQLRHPMLGDHARVLASAIGELRRAVKCEPVVFELMPDRFTLFELQKTVEAILGPHLHKQNFRRLVETGGLVEPVGEYRLRTGGRPAQLYRFRRDVVLERPAPGMRIKSGRA